MIKQIAVLLCISAVLIICGCTEKQASVSTSSQLPSQYILLNRSATLTHYIGEYSEPDAGKVFLLIKMSIENHGYNSFAVNPNYFGVIIDKVAYPYDKATYSTKSPITSLTLLDGGRTDGYLVFQIPSDKSSYTLGYVGPGDYNIIYGKLEDNSAKPPVKEAPKLPIRNITYDLGPGIQATTSSSAASESGIITQTTTINAGDNGYATIIIKAANATIDKNKLINDAMNIQKVREFNVYDKGQYDASLANGDKVTVHLKECAAFTGHNGQVSMAAFELDASNVVIITSTLDKYRLGYLLGSLKIGGAS